MRSTRVLSLVTGAALLAACGGDGNGPSNPAPTAGFTFSCAQLVCTFTSTSTDVAPGTIASYNWDFGDGSADVATQNATRTYTAAGTYAVQLTVTDNGGEDNSLTQQVTVTAAPPQNQAPVANFTSSCSSQFCTFTNTSTDADGTFTSSWDFGDGSPDSDNNLSTTHTYTNTTLTDYTVTLTVTDDDGATAQQTAVLSVSPPATLTCGSTPDCSLAIDQPATVTVTLVSSSCELPNNTFRVTITPPGGGTPVQETLFTDGCNVPDNTTYQLQSGAVIASGTQITAQVISGGTTLEIDPAIRVTGTFATGWTLEFDDGAKAGPPPEPDFDDLIITIVATP